MRRPGLPLRHSLRLAGVVAIAAYASRRWQAGLRRSPGDALAWRHLVAERGGAARVNLTTTSAEAGGAYYEFEEYVPAGAPGFAAGRPGSPPRHVHPKEVETFEVLAGEFAYELEGEARAARAGDTVVVPPGAAHHFWNPSETEELRIRVRIEPPNPMGEAFFENIAGLMRDGYAADPVAMLQLFRAAGIEFAEGPAWSRVLTNGVVPVVANYVGYVASHDAYVYPCYERAYRASPERRDAFASAASGGACADLGKCDPYCWFAAEADRTQKRVDVAKRVAELEAERARLEAEKAAAEGEGAAEAEAEAEAAGATGQAAPEGADGARGGGDEL